MGGFSPIHLLVLAVVAILLLGGGRFSSLMGDVAKGLKSFKQGMAEDETKAKPGDQRQLPREEQPIDITPSAPPPSNAAPPPPPADEQNRS